MSYIDHGHRLRELERGASLTDALAVFDALPAVTVPEILGSWRGSGLPTGNPLDGLLEVYGWYGKRFVTGEDVHPLVFQDARGRFAVNPAGLPMSALPRWGRLARDPRVAGLARSLLRLRRTHRPAARLRMMEYRGVTTATMCYDALPIHDHFRGVDPDTLLGAMDLRGLTTPFLFVLRRDTAGHS